MRQRRIAVVSLLGLLLGLPTALVMLRLPPKEGWGHWLYWLHDHFFLPLKGYAYTLFFPYSLPALLVGSALLLAWLYFFVKGESLVKPLHLAFLKRALLFTSWHAFLLRSASFFAYRGFPPRLMMEVCSYLRQDRLEARTAGNDAGERASLVFALTCLEIELATLPGRPHLAKRRVLSAFVASFTLLRRHVAPEHLHRDLPVASIRRAIMDLVGAEVRTDLKALLDDETHLSPASMALDLLHLLALVDAGVLKDLPHPPETAPTAAALTHFTSLRLALSATRRQSALEAFRDELEDRLLRFRQGYTRSITDPTALLDEGFLPDYGSLCLDLAFVQADLDGDVHAALSLMESFECLHLMLTLPDEDSEEGLLVIYDRLQAFCGHLPRAPHYARCADLSHASLKPRLNAWKNSHFHGSGLVLADDFSLAVERVDAMRLASGPVFYDDLGGGAS